MEEQNHLSYAMILSSSSVLPMVLKTAIDLGLFDILSESGSSSASQIVSHLSDQTKIQHDSSLVNRILRFLASYSIVTCSVSTNQNGEPCAVYGLAPVAKYFTKKEDGGGSLAPLVNLFQDKIVMDMWYNLKDSVLEGGLPFNNTHGTSAIEFVGRDSRFREVFQSSMRGIEHVGGDMFTGIPKGEAIFMKWMLHSWDDEDCVKILCNCYESLPLNGKVIVVDMAIPDFPGDTLLHRILFQFELFMMNMNPSGKERTKREFEILARRAGFSNVQFPFIFLCFSVVEFHKND